MTPTLTQMPTPTPSPTPVVGPKVAQIFDAAKTLKHEAVTLTAPVAAIPTPISLTASLESTIRVWLTARDEALYCLCSGVDEPLAEINIDELVKSVERVNQLRALAYNFADQIKQGTDSVEAVLARSLHGLLSHESPRFKLHINDNPLMINSF